MTKRTLFIIAIFCMAVIFSACKSSKPPEIPTTQPSVTTTPALSSVVAQIKIKSGSAEYRAQSSTDFVPTSNSTGVSIGDRVRSAPGAQISVEFLDGSVLVLLENTEIEIQNYEVTREGDNIVARVARVAVINGDVSGDVRQDLIYPPSVFEVVTRGEIYTIKGTITSNVTGK